MRFLTVLLIAAAAALVPAGAATAPASAASPCGLTGTAPAVTHVIVVMLENRSYSQVVGNSAAPYETALAAECGNATEAFGATHWSAANYLATSAGEYPASSAKGCNYAACADSGPSIYSQLDSAGLTWKAYEESMPSPCDKSTAMPYKIGHNPPIFYPASAAPNARPETSRSPVSRPKPARSGTTCRRARCPRSPG
jgi:phospholipase C